VLEGEICSSFELLRRLSKAVSQAVEDNTFPLVLLGNCMATVAVACGLYFIHSFHADIDLDSAVVKENGYFDAMGLSMLRRKSWKALTNMITGFEPFDYSGQFLYCGLRGQSDLQRRRVLDAGKTVIWGRADCRVNFVAELERQLESGP
jgi:arginase